MAPIVWMAMPSEARSSNLHGQFCRGRLAKLNADGNVAEPLGFSMKSFTNSALLVRSQRTAAQFVGANLKAAYARHPREPALCNPKRISVGSQVHRNNSRRKLPVRERSKSFLFVSKKSLFNSTPRRPMFLFEIILENSRNTAALVCSRMSASIEHLGDFVVAFACLLHLTSLLQLVRCKNPLTSALRDRVLPFCRFDWLPRFR